LPSSRPHVRGHRRLSRFPGTGPLWNRQHSRSFYDEAACCHPPGLAGGPGFSGVRRTTHPPAGEVTAGSQLSTPGHLDKRHQRRCHNSSRVFVRRRDSLSSPRPVPGRQQLRPLYDRSACCHPRIRPPSDNFCRRCTTLLDVVIPAVLRPSEDFPGSVEPGNPADEKKCSGSPTLPFVCAKQPERIPVGAPWTSRVERPCRYRP